MGAVRARSIRPNHAATSEGCVHWQVAAKERISFESTDWLDLAPNRALVHTLTGAGPITLAARPRGASAATCASMHSEYTSLLRPACVISQGRIDRRTPLWALTRRSDRGVGVARWSHRARSSDPASRLRADP
ncbi:MAG: hypothetical protein HS106_07565 [Ideonella sp.]|nr:hypothetical protein [Ideonella sp.]